MDEKLLGKLEQKVMNVIWEAKKPLKPSEVITELNKLDKYAYTTIMTVLSRLYKKKFVKREKIGKAFYYSELKGKKDYAEGKLKGLFKNILASYKGLAVTNFVDALEKTSPEELERLKKYIDQKSNKTT